MTRAHVVLFGILIVVLASRYGAGQETETDLSEMSRDELRTLLNEKTARLQTLRQKYYRGLRERERKIRSATQQRNELESRLEKLTSQKEERTGTLATLRNQIDGLEEKQATLSDFTSMFRAKVSTFREQLREYVRRTVPYRRADRLKKIAPASEGSGEQASSKLVSRLRRLWRQALNEFRSARSAGVHKRDVRLPDGREKFSRVARIGYRIQFFVTDDQKEAGVWVPAAGDGANRWRVVLLNDRDPLIRALDMIRGHAAPGRVLLPVTLNVKEE